MENDRQTFTRSPLIRIFSIILGICFFCVFSIFAYEVFPRYVVFSFPPPIDDYGVDDWMFPTHATWRNWSDRYFVWRVETILVYENIPDDKLRESIVTYFDEKLNNSGWARAENVTASCHYIMPEVDFLNYLEDFSQNGYIAFIKKSDHDSFNWTNESTCIAIWNTSPGTFSVVILSARPSPFTRFFNWIFE